MFERDMSTEDDDPLDGIFVNDDEIDRELIASILEPYVTIGEDEGRLYTTDAYQELNSKEKILVTLAAQRAKVMRGVAESGEIGPSRISDLSNVSEGTVKPGVRELAEMGLIDDSKDGYSITGPLLQRVSNHLNTDD